MHRKFLLAVFLSGLALLAEAGPLQHLEHTTLVPRDSSPDDKPPPSKVFMKDPRPGEVWWVAILWHG